jgi:hypothetical protein
VCIGETQEEFRVRCEERYVGEKGDIGLAEGVMRDLSVRLRASTDPAGYGGVEGFGLVDEIMDVVAGDSKGALGLTESMAGSGWGKMCGVSVAGFSYEVACVWGDGGSTGDPGGGEEAPLGGVCGTDL